MSFNVADKVDRHTGQDLEHFLGQIVALDILPANGKQSDPGTFHAERQLRINLAHNGELRQIERCAVRIGADVNKNIFPADRRHQTCKSRTVNAPQSTETHFGCRNRGSRMPG